MKKIVLAVLSLTILAGGAEAAKIKGVGFAAPTVVGTSNVYAPEVGAIVYDQSTSLFYGFNSSNTWQPFGDSNQGAPEGTISAFAGTAAPTGYLLCDGAAVSRATYADLFAVIGTNYGAGDGTTTFNVPDLRGRFLRGVDGAAGNDPDSSSRTAMNSGGNTGNNVGSVQDDMYKSHSHGLVGSGTLMHGAGGVGGMDPYYSPVTNTMNAGGNETRPKNAYVNFIIKY